jgi:hypothetical protein
VSLQYKSLLLFDMYLHKFPFLRIGGAPINIIFLQ